MDIVKFFPEAPSDFSPEHHIVFCFCKLGEKILLLKRHPQKPQGGTWALPGGKMEKGETPKEAVIRETFEEVGLDASEAEDAGIIYMRYNDVDYLCYAFSMVYEYEPLLTLSMEEHTESRWLTLEETKEIPLIPGGEESFAFYQKFLSNKQSQL